MKQRSILTFAVALFVLASVMAAAQGGRRGGMMGRQGGLQMLSLPAVQTELKMTPEQVGKVAAKQQEVRDGMRGLFQGGFANLTPAERQQRTEKTQELNDKAAADILDATQLKRYHELELQQQGPTAIGRKAVATELKLTDDQQKKLTDIQTQADTDRRAAMQGQNFQTMSDADRQALTTKLQQAQKAENDKILTLLTDAQKTQWQAMQGTPFTFPAPAATGGGPRPGQ